MLLAHTQSISSSLLRNARFFPFRLQPCARGSHVYAHLRLHHAYSIVSIAIVSTGSQTVLTLRASGVDRMQLPNPGAEVMPGVTWGRFDEFFTPAFWVARIWIDGPDASYVHYTLGRSLTEEVAACLLGGYGMPAELGLAAFRRLKRRRLLIGCPSAAELEVALAEPMMVGGRAWRYRYPRMKGRYLATALRRLAEETGPADNRGLRDWLMTFDGIGPKTASWITRNHRHCDDVAILDVHIQRAGRLAGIFSDRDRVERDYFTMESRLVRFAAALQMRLSVLDSVIWCYMKQLAGSALPSFHVAGICR